MNLKIIIFNIFASKKYFPILKVILAKLMKNLIIEVCFLLNYELLISLSANILSHLEKNVVDGLSVVRAESYEGSFVVLRELHEDVVILLEERCTLELNNECSCLLECFNHVVVILLVFIESS